MVAGPSTSPQTDVRRPARYYMRALTGSHVSVLLRGDQTNSISFALNIVPSSGTAPFTREDYERDRFRRIMSRWRDETSDLSQVSRIVANRNYLTLASFGKRALPWILADLRDNGGYWFPILEVLTGEQPETAAERATRGGMRQAWLRWGRSEGYL